MKTSGRLTLTLLGGFQATLGTGPALVFPTKKTQALLAYLALPLGQAHAREKLATVFWGDMQDAQARGNLRHALSRIRGALPLPARRGLVLDGTNVALDGSVVDVDVALFERLVADGSREALEQVVAVYRGDLLAGLTLDERTFAEWLTSERERLHELAIQALGRLLGDQQKAGAAEPAVHTALRLLALDPLQEPVHRAIMRLYARLGRRGVALRQYEICVELLKRELRTAPEAETTQLYQTILASRPLPWIEDARPDPDGGAAAPMLPLPSQRPLANLPAPTSELIGRDAALAEIADLLRAHRLVTLVGAGGVGKTRLGVEVARQLLPSFADGAWVAELAALSDPELVHVTVASALGLTLPSGAGSPEHVAAALGAHQLLVVLDNCEHVIESAARMAEALLRADPYARVLATSREPLRVPGEHVYRVPSLEVPAEGAEDHEDSLRAPAVKLFIARVRAMEPRFPPDTRSAAIAGAICRRLDGIPLAIELAAGRAGTLAMEEIAARLDDRFRLLTVGYRTALPRHQTLRATFDWSYELLTTDERAVLRCLGVFAGGFTLEAAGAVATTEDVMAGVTSLVAKSLVAMEVDGAVTRYRLLETTRAYAMEKLTQSGELGLISRRHAEFYRHTLERAEAQADTQPTPEWLAPPGHDIANVRAALGWAFSSDGDASIGVALTVASVPLWIHLSLIEECREHAERALSGAAAGSSRQDMLLYAALGASLMQTKGSVSATGAAWTRVLEIARNLDDTEYQLRARWGLCVYHFNGGEFRTAVALARELYGLAEKQAAPPYLLAGDRMTGLSLHLLGDQAAARHHLERMLSRYAAPPQRSNARRFVFDEQVTARSFLARILWLQGFPDEAMRTVHSNVEDALRGEHALSLCNALVQAACPVALLVGDLPSAERFVAMLLDRATRHALVPWQVWGRCLEGVLIAKRGDAVTGSQLLGTALDELRKIQFVVYHTAFLGQFAEALGQAGRVDAGLVAIDEALRRSEHTDERWCLSELLRIKGELVLLEGAPSARTAAEGHFRQGLHWARQQGALSWELRCAMSLARLWHQHGRTHAARELLAPVYGRFTEGFDSVDLKAGEELLGRLRARAALGV